ncbi:MAG: hypothetical protein ACE5D7_05980, partial [Fidelibacterota bacterium]
MTQTKQIIEVMKNNGGYATLGFLYQNVKTKNWKTKTPFASIRRIVQDNRYFFKIRPGLWALNSFRKQIAKKFEIDGSQQKESEFTHYYYQGLILEIGNLKGFNTYIPPQDKNKIFLDKTLSDLSTTNEIYKFTYDGIVKRAKTVDVIWFNKRNLPSYFFEVEHSTDFQNSLLKYFDLQDFHSKFFIISHA